VTTGAFRVPKLGLLPKRGLKVMKYSKFVLKLFKN